MKKQYQLKLNTIEKTDKNKYYIAFSYLNFRPLFKAKLFEFFDFDIERTFNVDENDLKNFSEQTDMKIPKDFLKKKNKLDIDACFENALKDKEVGIVTYEDEKYPPLLRQIPDFPLLLYYKGDIENMDYSYTLAVVGSRKASNEGAGAMSVIIRGFYTNPVVIVSGLAYGIDAAAHRAALSVDLKTIAVVGSGLDIIYPTQNTQLFDEILEKHGVIFSEYPLGTQPTKYTFPQRNRIVVGMCQGTFVAEAQLKSGAMISANLTLDYNRELMCMPGCTTNPNTEGIYHLIKQGAGIACYTNDILEILNWNFKITEKYDPVYELTENQKRIYDIITFEAKSFDEILTEAQTNASSLMATLTELELNGLIKQADNKFYKCVW